MMVAVRAAGGQGPLPAGQRGDPYAPQYQQAQPAGSGYATPPSGVSPGPNQALRYPLPPPGPPAAGPIASPTGADRGEPPGLHAPVQRTDLFQPGLTVARVGDKVIFYGEVAAIANLVIDSYLSKAKSEEERRALQSQIESEREALIKNLLKQMVQTKLLFHEFDRDMRKQIGKDDKKYLEAKAGMTKKIRSVFEERLNECREKLRTATPEQVQKLMVQDPTVTRLATLMKDRQLESFGELDAVLRQLGTTLDDQITSFGEHQLGMQAVIKHIKKVPEVTHQEMLDYYTDHAAEYAVPAKVKFEILTVKFANFRTREEAHDLIVQMGNAVFLGGTPFAAVAKKHSQEPNASSGGLYESVSQGSLASKTIDQAVFSLEIKKLSQIIEDETGYHILRVLERQPAGYRSFVDAQPEIKTEIETEKRMAQQKEFLEEVQARTAVWTIYDDMAKAAAAPTAQPR